MTYAEKLKDPRWQRKRLEILQRDNFTCQLCESTTKTLHVHHKYYIKGKEPWDYATRSLVTLCFECHQSEEELAVVKADFLNAWFNAGLFNVDMEGYSGHISNIRLPRHQLVAIVSYLSDDSFAEKVFAMYQQHLKTLPPPSDDLLF